MAASGIKESVFMALGFFDYVQDKLEDLRDEWVERGEQKGEDLMEFFDDLIENLPMIAKNAVGVEDEEPGNGGGKSNGGRKGLRGQLNLKGSIREFVDGLGLASAVDLKGISGRIEELAEKLKGRS